MSKKMRKSNEYYEIDLLQMLEALWSKAWALVLAAIAGGGIAFLYSALWVTPLYEAEAMMYVNNTSFSVGSTSFSIDNAELTAAQSLVDTYIIILNSRSTLNEVIDETGVHYNYKELKSMVDAEPVNGTEVFSITVTSDSPQEAELIANAIVEVLPDKIADVVDGSSVRVVDYAVIPSEKASPNITMFTAVGMLLGITAASMLVIIQIVRDTLIHDEDYLMETYDLPVLAVIPDLFSSKNRDDYYNAYGTKEKMEVKRQ